MNDKIVASELMKIASLLSSGKKAPKGKLIVELQAVPNHDYMDNDNPKRNMRIKPHFVVVRDVKDASRACTDFISDNGLGGGNWFGGEIFDDKGELIGHISANGRAWEGGKLEYPTKEIKF